MSRGPPQALAHILATQLKFSALPRGRYSTEGTRDTTTKHTVFRWCGMTSILVLNGPNLNLLGRRETGIYGTLTLADIEQMCRSEAEDLGVSVDFAQDNSEGALVDQIHSAQGHHAGLILNAGAYTHSSMALRDAIVGTGLPTIELHLSNVFAREPFRHVSYISPVAVGVICGLGAQGYSLALRALFHHLSENSA